MTTEKPWSNTAEGPAAASGPGGTMPTPLRTVFRQPVRGCRSRFTTALLALTLLPRVRENPALTWSFWGAAAVLLVWQAVLLIGGQRRSGRSSCHAAASALRPGDLSSEFTPTGDGTGGRSTTTPGCWWRSCCSRTPSTCCCRGRAASSYALGFGPFPIVFSTNLFLWFRDDWFYLQFLLVAVGFLGKEFVRWERRAGASTSSTPPPSHSRLFSLVLIATGTTHLTWGQEIATTLSLAPHIYLYLFLVGLVVMYFFSITPVAASAAATLFAASALYVVGDRRAVLPRFRDPACGISGTAPARHRSIHLAGDAAGPDHLRRALRARRVRPVLAARRHRRADLLRQAAVRPDAEPDRAVDRSGGSCHRPSPRPDRLGSGRTAGTRQPGPDGGMDRLLRRHDCSRRHRRAAPGRHAALLAAGMPGRPAPRVRAPGAARVGVLRRQRRLGVQRAGQALHGGKHRRRGS